MEITSTIYVISALLVSVSVTSYKEKLSDKLLCKSIYKGDLVSRALFGKATLKRLLLVGQLTLSGIHQWQIAVSPLWSTRARIYREMYASTRSRLDFKMAFFW